MIKKIFITGICVLLLSSCVNVPDGIEPVENFKVQPYLGTWYEIARFDHSFERGLNQVTANYSLRDDGGIRVLNKGYSSETGEWEDAEGRAYFVDEEDSGFLKVSFFGPFFGSYIIFELDEDYQYSYVSGPDKSYLWFLSRTPEVDASRKADFEAKAKELGFDTDALIWVEQ